MDASGHTHWMRRCARVAWRPVALACVCGLLGGGCAHSSPPPGAVSAWRVGPLLEGVRTGAGQNALAVRPFYSHECVNVNPTQSVTDVLWPAGSFSRRGERLRWRLFPAYGSDADDEPDGSYRFRLLPIYFEGRTREGDSYHALFPLGGTIRDFMFMDRASFFLFPLYGESEQAGTHTRTALWPIWLTRHGDDIEQWRLFPFYGEKRVAGRRPHTNRFILWPFWTETHYRGEHIEGDAFVLFPIYGRSRFAQEQGWMVLPPFFSYTRGTNGYRRLRAPWPFVRQLDDGPVTERHWWPLYGTKRAPGRERWYTLWPIVSGAREEGARATVKRFNIAPLYNSEERLTAATNGAPAAPTSAYRRVWPLFSWRREPSGTQVRVPELTFFKNNAAIERNWAPFWSWFVRRERADGARVTDVLWGLAAWGRNADRRPFGQFLWFFTFGHGAAAESPAAAEITTAEP
ncbi:MAG: hypothetical protein PHR35_05620 [Kiritimatiellae bacterium]|nr:hypothetical protein [Kiritimatiellia bacterium]